METKYSELTAEEQDEVDDELDDQPEILEAVQEDHYCAKCYMVWYNCLCSHDD